MVVQEQGTGRPLKRTEVFHRPNPFDLIKLTATFDDRDLTLPPKTYFPATDPELQLATVTDNLRTTFQDDLLFVGLTGSRATGKHRLDSDVDVLAVVDKHVTGEEISFEGDLKLVSKSGLREFIEHGYQLITTQFRKAKPTFVKGDVLAELATYKVIPEKALPFLVAKSHFNEQTADILRLVSDKHRAISLYMHGFSHAAFSQLDGIPQDELFQSILATNQEDGDDLYAKLAIYYANLGLNRMFHSLSEMVQCMHIQEVGDVADVEELVHWGLGRFPQEGALLTDLYKTRIECYKQGRILADEEFTNLRENTKVANVSIGKLITL